MGEECEVYWGDAGTGIITVTETTQNGNCQGSKSGCVDIINKPTAVFTILSPQVMESGKACVDENLIFIDGSTFAAGDNIMSWHWDFGDGTSAVGQGPHSHVYTEPKTYVIKLTVTNSCGCIDWTTFTLTVSAIRSLKIVCPSVVCEGQEVTYAINEPQLNCENLLWQVTGGTINGPNNQPQVKVVWNNVDDAGFGYITLNAECDERCVGTTTEKIPVVKNSGKIVGPELFCAGQEFVYRLPAWPGTIYEWELSDPSAANLTMSYNFQPNEVVVKGINPGTIELICHYRCEIAGCEGTAVLTLEIEPAIMITGPVSICSGNPAAFSLTSAPSSVNWQWKMTRPDNTVFMSSPGTQTTFSTGTLTQPGKYYIEVVTDQVCNASVMQLQVFATPDPPENITGELYICGNQLYTYNTPVTSFWEVTGGSIIGSATGKQVNIVFDGSGTYIVKAQAVTNGPDGCNVSDFTELEVYDEPIVPVISSNPGEPCPSQYKDYSAGFEGADDYHWTITPSIYGSVISGQGTKDVNILWNEPPGTCTLSVQVTKCGRTVTATMIITTTGELPTTISAPAPTCGGSTASFTTALPAAKQVTWNFGDGSNPVTQAGTVSHIFPKHTSPVIYNISASYTNNCDYLTTVTQQFTVLPVPSVHISPAGPFLQPCGDPGSRTLTANLSSGVTTITWYTPSGNNTCGVPPSCTKDANQFGDYYVVATANGCSNSSNIVRVIEDCGIPPGTCVATGNPSVSVSLTNNSCGHIELTGDPMGGTNPTWLSNLSNLSSSPTTVFEAQAPSSGQYQITYTAGFPGIDSETGESCIATKSATQVVIVPVMASLAYNSVCTPTGHAVTIFDRSSKYPGTVINSVTYLVDGNPVSSFPTTVPPGPHTLQLLVTYTDGGTITCSSVKNINLPAIPTASFTVDYSTICQDVPVQFSNNSTPSNASFYWNFGDGSGNKKAEPGKTFASTNLSYNVTLTVSAYGCTITSSPMNIEVVPNMLYGSISPSSLIICAGGTGNLSFDKSNFSSTPVKYYWKNGHDDYQLVFYNNQVSVNTSGNYWVKVVDANKCEFTANKNNPIKVAIVDAPNPSIAGRANYCDGESIELSGQAGDGYIYKWYRDGLLLGSTSQDLNDLQPFGVYQYVLVVDNGYCERQSDPYTVTVNQKPLPPGITQSIPDCEDFEITLTATAPAGFNGTFAWSNGDVGATTTVNIGGYYQVWFSTGNGCNSSWGYDITHLDPRPFMWIFPTGCYTRCPEVFPITVPGTLKAMEQWEWFRNNLPFSPPNNGVKSPVAPLVLGAADAGTYHVEIGDGGACTYRSGNLYYSPYCDGSGCDFDIISEFKNCGPDGRSPSYTFFIDNPNNAPIVYTVVPQINGSIGSIQGVAAAASWSQLDVVLHPIDNPGNPITFIFTFWIPGEEPCVKEIQVENPCFESGRPAIPIVRHDSPVPIKKENTLKLIPNPAKDHVQVHYTSANGNEGLEVELLDIMGRAIRVYKLNGTAGFFTLPLFGLNDNLYLVRIKQYGKVLKTEKVLISR